MSDIYKCWLPEKNDKRLALWKSYFTSVYADSSDKTTQTAVRELRRAARIRTSSERTGEGFALVTDESLGAGGYRIGITDSEIVIAGGDGSGKLYGVLRFLTLAAGSMLKSKTLCETPAYPLRIVDHWDNADGTVERGYSGGSLFFREDRVSDDNEALTDYARLLASVGINAVCPNNVNVHDTETLFITDRYLGDFARIAKIFRGYGIRLFLSVNFAAPTQIGGLDTADPLDDSVRKWWSSAAAEIYRRIPDFGGFVVKADSEGRPGPHTYGRDHADGANMLAEALAPYGGAVIWRCFVYNCRTDRNDRSTDRAKAAYDNFLPLDGRFADNVYLQIKNGPMDFQIREPVSPLFGALNKTNMLAEFQITQEYTGQQIDLCYLVPMWKECLDFGKRHGQVKDRIQGAAGVSNTGDGAFLTGNPLAGANLYGFGRLLFDPEQSADRIAAEWVCASITTNKIAAVEIVCMLVRSREIYESYTSPLGVGWMVVPGTHYGVDVDGYEYSRWGTYHYADGDGIGADRTQATGTGYTAQYDSVNARLYEDIKTCPDELLLFFHHVPYTHVLHSGKTVIQHIYDSHFEGAEQAAGLLKDWKSLESYIPADIYAECLHRFELQAANSENWRDVVNTYFFRKSGIPDSHGRKIYE
ncbi:MAG: alpha-glucuronidase [Ruminiclostridium sp.]|nr:alpha-glucuronidase [Ruminiclostridium sp.]